MKHLKVIMICSLIVTCSVASSMAIPTIRVLGAPTPGDSSSGASTSSDSVKVKSTTTPKTTAMATTPNRLTRAGYTQMSQQLKPSTTTSSGGTSGGTSSGSSDTGALTRSIKELANRVSELETVASKAITDIDVYSDGQYITNITKKDGKMSITKTDTLQLPIKARSGDRVLGTAEIYVIR